MVTKYILTGTESNSSEIKNPRPPALVHLLTRWGRKTIIQT